MSVLMEVLAEELDRLARQEVVCSRDLAELPKGYISKKNIRGRESYYLQWREGDKIVSKYISAEDLPKVEAQVERRKRLESALRRIREDRKKLQKVLGKGK